MNNTLTLEAFENIVKKLKPIPREFDTILFTNRQYNQLLETGEVFSSTELGSLSLNRIAGYPFEIFYNERDLLKRAAELIGEGKKVAIIK